jgi:hypothetical protein
MLRSELRAFLMEKKDTHQKGTKSAKKYPLLGFATYATFCGQFLDAGFSDPNAPMPGTRILHGFA